MRLSFHFFHSTWHAAKGGGTTEDTAAEEACAKGKWSLLFTPQLLALHMALNCRVENVTVSPSLLRAYQNSINNISCLPLVFTNLIIWLFYQPNCNFLLPIENKAVCFHTAHCCCLWVPRRLVCSAHLRVGSGQSHLLAVVLAPFLPDKGNAYLNTWVFGVSTLNEKQQHLQENWRTVHASLFSLLFIFCCCFGSTSAVK